MGWTFRCSRVPQQKPYLGFLRGSGNNIGVIGAEFSWDDKYVGAQVLVAKVMSFSYS